MQIKKYPDAILENYSKILIQLGLVLSLFIVYEFMRMKSFPGPIEALSGTFITMEDSEETIEIKPKELQVQPQVKVIMPDKILKVEDEIDIQETIIETTEIDESDAVILNVENDIITVEEEEEVVEDVPFIVIEEVPIFPGCTGSNKELRACFSNQISKFILNKFNAELASDIGLKPGSIQRIFVVFKIDKNGDITDINARAPHKKLKEEAIRVIKLLPKMIPGKQRHKPVSVSYGLPIVFKVE